MKKFTHSFLVCALLAFSVFGPSSVAWAEGGAKEEEPEKGPHRGRMLREGDFALELAIFETGVPPEFRVWATDDGEAVRPEDVKLGITLIRLGGVEDNIKFRPQDDFLRGDMEIYEPHSFEVVVNANYQGESYRWHYENFEGRVRIATDIAQAMGIETEKAGTQTLTERLPTVGKLIAPKAANREVSARFSGLITKVDVEVGQEVKRGDVLFTVEGDESLKRYSIRSPISGQVIDLNAAEGELTSDRVLARVVDTAGLLAEVNVFPADARRVSKGQEVLLSAVSGDEKLSGKVVSVVRSLSEQQAATVQIALNEMPNQPAGSFVHAHIAVDHYTVPLAVKRSGLQSFRDFTVVYAKVGDQYEVRMLELGREAGEWVEVLGGLEPGTEYVTENSYLIKADIEKSGASHDH